MFYKLIKNGVRGKSLKILIDMFNKSPSMVQVNAASSETIDSSYGVLQGGVLSPKLTATFVTWESIWIIVLVLTYIEEMLPIYCTLTTLFCWLQQLKGYTLNYRIYTTNCKYDKYGI